ncbi:MULTISPECIES: LysE family transporter [Rhodomicrobium]|uniref:LysE family translocator n=1 Tax=Rhodomicrobium TaxID=1068 RepID=UPI000B4B02BC|nr:MULTISPECIES: LysE family transporter [Rhodomicrobium]
MSLIAQLAAIAGTLLIGAMIPGPSFVVVARNAVGISRYAGFVSALGIGIGGVLYSCVALMGLYTIFAAASWLYVVLKCAGGAYLVYVAIMIWRHAPEPLSVAAADGRASRTIIEALGAGFITHVSNPKVIIFYGGIFSALLPSQPPVWCYLVIPVLVFFVEAGWFAVVALGFSSTLPREFYLRSKTAIDRVAAAAIGALGLRLVLKSADTGL